MTRATPSDEHHSIGASFYCEQSAWHTYCYLPEGRGKKKTLAFFNLNVTSIIARYFFFVMIGSNLDGSEPRCPSEGVAFVMTRHGTSRVPNEFCEHSITRPFRIHLLVRQTMLIQSFKLAMKALIY